VSLWHEKSVRSSDAAAAIGWCGGDSPPFRACLDDKIYFQEAFQFMIVVRNTFIAKPGQASKLAAQLKEMAAAGKLPNHRVLTDVTGEFNRVVMEYEVESMVGFEETFKKYTSDPQIREKAKGYTDLWITGSRELFRVV
jgi:hypothetical protein